MLVAVRNGCLAGLLPLLLAACAGTSPGTKPDPVLTPMPTPSPAPAPMRTGSQEDEGACERAVTQQTNNPDVVTLSSQFSQANTEVIVGVGAQRARWRCLVSRGRVAEVMSLTDEGAL
ncbi:hypothetical protein CSC94_16185 [Zhengella mangrovi]|uniref:Uncharacterized protein n=1 Tax=Zhengella mangrovi TaxID=1982044 RepID=A0A2G1QKY8_9HYPH|nr:hypothetical protein [Zhengella mangrovi]PHP66134.1 hypothetical protein CSC94_16185 [Zhengella mangrovi]